MVVLRIVSRHFQDVARQSMLKSTPDYSEEAIHFRWAKEADANAVAELVNTAFEIESRCGYSSTNSAVTVKLWLQVAFEVLCFPNLLEHVASLIFF